MKYYILDKDGNYISGYETTMQLADVFNTSAGLFTRCANNISKLIKGEKPSTGALSVKNIVCVKKEDYINHLDKIKWILTKDDILAIDKSGRIVSTYKSLSDALRTLNPNGTISSSNGKRTLNVVDKEAYGYRLATREHYIQMLKEDVFYYSREFDNESGRDKVPVNMYNFKTGEFIRSFESLAQTASYMGCSVECIRQAIKRDGPILNTDYCFEKADV